MVWNIGVNNAGLKSKWKGSNYPNSVEVCIKIENDVMSFYKVL